MGSWPDADARARFDAELVGLVNDPQVRLLATHWAGSREVAEDALQDTFLAIYRVREPDSITDLRRYFYTTLRREIIRQRMFHKAIPVGISLGDEVGQELPSPYSLENDISELLLTEEILTRLEREHRVLRESIPGRSKDPHRYKMAIAEAARQILLLLQAGDMSSSDWNMILKREYPEWWDDTELVRATSDQRLSRGCKDVRHLLELVAKEALSLDSRLRRAST